MYFPVYSSWSEEHVLECLFFAWHSFIFFFHYLIGFLSIRSSCVEPCKEMMKVYPEISTEILPKLIEKINPGNLIFFLLTFISYVVHICIWNNKHNIYGAQCINFYINNSFTRCMIVSSFSLTEEGEAILPFVAIFSVHKSVISKTTEQLLSKLQQESQGTV